MAKSSIGDRAMPFKSNLLEGEMKSGTGLELTNKVIEEMYGKQEINSDDETVGDFISTFDDLAIEESDPYSYEQNEGEGTSKAFGYDEIKEPDSPSHDQKVQKIVLAVNLSSRIKRLKMKAALRGFQGIKLIDYDKKERKLTVIGDVDYVTLGTRMRKIVHTDLLSVGPASERLATQYHKPGYKSGDEDEPGYDSDGRIKDSATGEGQQSSLAHPCRLFSLAEMQSATKSFAHELVIGRGGFGEVFKGHISREKAVAIVAIKRWDSMHYRAELEFRAEIDMLFKFHHRHLMPLIGYYYDNKEKIIVYEYFSNGTLYHHLHEVHTPLSWVTRLKIAIGAASGLDYLHTSAGTRHGVIHRDVKSANIYLNENWEAVISDFELSKIGPTDALDSHVTTALVSTIGYIDPEYIIKGRLTWKSDVYSLGVVLFELISGRRAIERSFEDEPSLVMWAKKCVEERRLDEMVDSNIKGTVSTNCLKGFIQNAYLCVHNDPDERPTMSKLLTSLQSLLELQENSNPSAESPDA